MPLYKGHRRVWERANGPIPEGMVVHHINHQKHDNRLENLMLMTPEEHARHHNDKHPRTKVCKSCLLEYEPCPTKRQRSQTCGSSACVSKLQSTRAYERHAANGERDEAIRGLAAQGVLKKDIAAAYGLSPASITRITKL